MNFFRMLEENGFSEPPNPFAMSFIRLLTKKGFSVTPTTKKNKQGNATRTLHIKWRDYVIGLMSKVTWGRQEPYACVYRFKSEGESRFKDRAPDDFNKEAFAEKHGCDSEMLYLHRNEGIPYLWVKDNDTSLRLMQDSARMVEEFLFPPRSSWEPKHLLNDLLTILDDRSKSEEKRFSEMTERFAEVAVRLGQGKFRTDLEREFENACAVTRLAVLPVLRASHIVPWRNSDDVQRRDPMNGLLLSANIDALFDRYMITFRPDGKLDVSKFITQTDLERLGPMQDLQRKPCDKRANYLERHNAEFDRFEQKRLENAKTSAR